MSVALVDIFSVFVFVFVVIVVVVVVVGVGYPFTLLLETDICAIDTCTQRSAAECKSNEINNVFD